MSYLKHHGVKGQKWGVRRYRNYDGSLIGSKKSKASKKKGKDTTKSIVSNSKNVKIHTDLGQQVYDELVRQQVVNSTNQQQIIDEINRMLQRETIDQINQQINQQNIIDQQTLHQQELINQGQMFVTQHMSMMF